MNPITPVEVINTVKCFRPKTSKGYDGISIKTVKDTINNISSPLSHIINMSFAKGIVPKQLKIANIVPIFKSGPKNNFNNYRPISLLPAFSKIFEKIVSKRLVTFLEKNDILYRHQYGFRKDHSTIHPIIQLLNHIADNNDKTTKDLTVSVFLDLSKAFDTIPHSALLKKLDHYGIRGITNTWFKSYLSDRVQFLNFNGTKSSNQPVNCGVPQGSILGPILFIIFINDLHYASNLDLLSFADDTTVYASGYQINELIEFMNMELENIFHWFCANKLQLNTSKSRYIIFGPPRGLPLHLTRELMINNEIIDRIQNTGGEKSIKFLGIHLDEHLTWDCHTSYICKRISQSLYIINRVKHFLPYRALRTLYFSLVHSYINYGFQIWGNSQHIGKLFLLQKRAIRTINKSPYRSHTEPLFKSSMVLKVEDLYKAEVVLFMYKFHNNLLPISFTDFHISKSSSMSMVTRQSGQMLMDRPRTNFSSRLPKHNFPKIWNSIDTNIKLSNSKHIFTKKMKSMLLKKYTSL